MTALRISAALRKINHVIISKRAVLVAYVYTGKTKDWEQGVFFYVPGDYNVVHVRL